LRQGAGGGARVAIQVRPRVLLGARGGDGGRPGSGADVGGGRASTTYLDACPPSPSFPHPHPLPLSPASQTPEETSTTAVSGVRTTLVSGSSGNATYEDTHNGTHKETRNETVVSGSGGNGMCRGAADCVDRESPAGSRQIELSLICALSREGSKVAALLKSTRYSVTMWEIYAWLCGIFMYVCMYVPMYACMHTLSHTQAHTHTHSVRVCVCIHNPLYWISYRQCTRALTFENVCLNKAWCARRERAHAQQRLLYCLSYDPCTRELTFENVCLNEARCARRARGRCWRQRGRCVCVSGHAHCVCMYVRTYVCAYACMHACMYVCMHIYLCMIYIHFYTYSYIYR